MFAVGFCGLRFCVVWGATGPRTVERGGRILGINNLGGAGATEGELLPLFDPPPELPCELAVHFAYNVMSVEIVNVPEPAT